MQENFPAYNILVDRFLMLRFWQKSLSRLYFDSEYFGITHYLLRNIRRTRQKVS